MSEVNEVDGNLLGDIEEPKEKGNLRRIGALWVKKSAAGQTYLSGELESLNQTIRIVAFKNDKKENERHPDYRIMVEVEK